MDLSATELMIILVIVIVLFGAGRIGKLGGELGTAIREFRRGLSGDVREDEKDPSVDDPTTLPPI